MIARQLRWRHWAALLVCVCGLTARCAQAKYNVTTSTASTLRITHSHPGDADCTAPGICLPTNVIVGGSTLWYWCGFLSTHRSWYNATSLNPKANITAHFFMRRDVLEECALKNLTTADSCAQLPETACSKAVTCAKRTFGLSFRDETCFVMVNNKTSAVKVSLQVMNYHDSPRDYGTAFSIIFLILGGSYIIYTVSKQLYQAYVAPPNKSAHHGIKTIKVSPSLNAKEVPLIIEDETPTGAGAGRVSDWFAKLSNKLQRIGHRQREDKDKEPPISA